MNKRIVEGVRVITHVYLFVYISMWLMMETIQGFQCHDFWRNSRIHPFETDPYHSNDILPQTHFEEILKSNTITD